VAAPSLGSPSVPSVTAPRNRFLQAKYLLFTVYGLAALVAIYYHDLALLDSNSPLRSHFAPIPRLIVLHGIPGATALVLGIFQFSDRLRRRYLAVHRVMGRIYVASVFIAAPAAVAVGFALAGPPTLHMADIIQASGWIFTTAVALYCVRHGNIQAHRQWMMRSYPYAMVFIFVRATLSIPAVARLGEVGLVTVVWSWIALCGFVPSAVIAWQNTFPRKAAVRIATQAAR
jgi:uncharacterized membrane protein